MKKAINRAIEKIVKDARGRHTAFVVGNTSGSFGNKRYYLIPIRETERLIYTGVIVRDVAAAAAVALIIDGMVDYVFVDAEKKIKERYYGNNDAGNIEREVRSKIFKSNIITYKGNDLTMEAVDYILGQLVADIAVVGCGNLGSKIALKFVERGAAIRAYRPDQKKLKVIVDGLNEIKSKDTLSSITAVESARDACDGASIVIACADKKGIVNERTLTGMDKSRPAILIDVGKGCFTVSVIKNNAYTVYRADVSIAQKHIFSALLETKLHYGQSMGRKVMEDEGITLVSMGLLGKYGEIIVDNIEKPSRIVGIADGKGSLVKDMRRHKKKLDTLQGLINGS